MGNSTSQTSNSSLVNFPEAGTQAQQTPAAVTSSSYSGLSYNTQSSLSSNISFSLNDPDIVYEDPPEDVLHLLTNSNTRTNNNDISVIRFRTTNERFAIKEAMFTSKDTESAYVHSLQKLKRLPFHPNILSIKKIWRTSDTSSSTSILFCPAHSKISYAIELPSKSLATELTKRISKHSAALGASQATSQSNISLSIHNHHHNRTSIIASTTQRNTHQICLPFTPDEFTVLVRSMISALVFLQLNKRTIHQLSLDSFRICESGSVKLIDCSIANLHQSSHGKHRKTSHCGFSRLASITSSSAVTKTTNSTSSEQPSSTTTTTTTNQSITQPSSSSVGSTSQSLSTLIKASVLNLAKILLTLACVPADMDLMQTLQYIHRYYGDRSVSLLSQMLQPDEKVRPDYIALAVSLGIIEDQSLKKNKQQSQQASHTNLEIASGVDISQDAKENKFLQSQQQLQFPENQYESKQPSTPQKMNVADVASTNAQTQQVVNDKTAFHLNQFETNTDRTPHESTRVSSHRKQPTSDEKQHPPSHNSLLSERSNQSTNQTLQQLSKQLPNSIQHHHSAKSAQKPTLHLFNGTLLQYPPPQPPPSSQITPAATSTKSNYNSTHLRSQSHLPRITDTLHQQQSHNLNLLIPSQSPLVNSPFPSTQSTSLFAQKQQLILQQQKQQQLQIQQQISYASQQQRRANLSYAPMDEVMEKETEQYNNSGNYPKSKEKGNNLLDNSFLCFEDPKEQHKYPEGVREKKNPNNNNSNINLQNMERNRQQQLNTVEVLPTMAPLAASFTCFNPTQNTNPAEAFSINYTISSQLNPHPKMFSNDENTIGSHVNNPLQQIPRGITFGTQHENSQQQQLQQQQFSFDSGSRGGSGIPRNIIQTTGQQPISLVGIPLLPRSSEQVSSNRQPPQNSASSSGFTHVSSINNPSEFMQNGRVGNQYQVPFASQISHYTTNQRITQNENTREYASTNNNIHPSSLNNHLEVNPNSHNNHNGRSPNEYSRSLIEKSAHEDLLSSSFFATNLQYSPEREDHKHSVFIEEFATAGGQGYGSANEYGSRRSNSSNHNNYNNHNKRFY